MTKLIVFDMDGIIFEHFNFWIELHKAYGTFEEGLKLTKEYVKTNYQKLVDEVIGRLWKGRPSSVYFELVKKVEYARGVKEVVTEVKKRGYKTAIISSGASDLAERAKKEIGIDYVYTNKLLIEGDKIAGSKDIKYWPMGSGNKADALRELCKMHNLFLKDVVIVVHEENDIKMAKSAGLAIAFNPTSKELEKYCNIIVKGEILTEILPHIP
ncbi:MAG: HAD family phosphatase [Nanoarchaeota archaeon]|nr:HAD family phosphatase [Nanoarchaeota archaeon]